MFDSRCGSRKEKDQTEFFPTFNSMISTIGKEFSVAYSNPNNVFQSEFKMLQEMKKLVNTNFCEGVEDNKNHVHESIKTLKEMLYQKNNDSLPRLVTNFIINVTLFIKFIELAVRQLITPKMLQQFVKIRLKTLENPPVEESLSKDSLKPTNPNLKELSKE